MVHLWVLVHCDRERARKNAVIVVLKSVDFLNELMYLVDVPAGSVKDPGSDLSHNNSVQPV
jgi:hypothetical protein